MPRNANQSKSTNYSLYFDGNDAIEIPQTTATDITGSNTIAMWVKRSTSGSNQNLVNKRGASGTQYAFFIETTNFLGFDDGTGAKAYGNTVIPTNAWTHVAVVVESSGCTFYVNGVPDGGVSSGISVGANTHTTYIGKKYTSTFYLNGKLSQVCFFDYALSESQVTTLWGGGTEVSNPMALPSPPIAYYPLGESAGGFVGGTGTWLTENNAIGDYVFDFNNDYINTGTGLGDSLGGSYSGDLTVSMWLKFDSTSAQYGLFYIGDLAGGGGSFWINTSASKLWLQADNGSAGYINCSISSLNTTDWYNVTCVYKGYDISNSKIYINNTPQTLTTFGNFNYTYDFTGKKTTIADYYTTPPFRGFDGKMSNVQLFNTALSGPEVETLYNYGSPIQTLASIPQSSNLKAWYKLDATEIYNLLSVDGFSATDNTGGGGGGGGSRFVSNPLYVGNGGSGGSGIVVLKYPTNLNAAFSAGLTKSDVINGSNTITSIKSGTGTVAFGNAGTISDYLIVAGGGGGGGAVNFSNGESSGGGGGGGGLLTGTSLSVSAQSYNITIGEGGSGGLKTTGGTIGSQGENGQDSIFSTLTAIGGGGGGAGQVGSNALSAGKNGGSGGGPGGSNGALTSAGGTGSQGSDGGAASNKRAGGGGGGYSNAGTAATSNEVPGNGGNGYLYSLTSTYYAGGGGAGVWYNTGAAPGGGLSGDGSTGIGGAPKQQGDITPEGPNFTNWWRILDNSNNSNDGASTGMTQSNLVQSDLQTVAPYSKYALSFDGNDDYITISGASDLSISGDLTMSMWFKANSFIDYEYILRLGSGTTTNGDRMIGFKSSKISTNTFADSSGAYDVLGNTTLSTGVWYHVLVVYSSNTVIIYLNGNADSSAIPTTMGTISYVNTEIGRGYSSRYFDGSISNVSIWNATLTSSQVREIYNEGRPSNLHNFSGTAPVAWWQLGENSSFNGNDWICADEIGSNNGESDGMPVGALTNGVGTTANGTSTGMSEGSLVGDAPYSTGNAISSGMPVTARVSGVSDATITTGGTGYAAGTNIATTGGSGANCTINITTVSGGVITAITINNGGSNYIIGDVLTVSGGNSNATITVSGLNTP